MKRFLIVFGIVFVCVAVYTLLGLADGGELTDYGYPQCMVVVVFFGTMLGMSITEKKKRVFSMSLETIVFCGMTFNTFLLVFYGFFIIKLLRKKLDAFFYISIAVFGVSLWNWIIFMVLFSEIHKTA